VPLNCHDIPFTSTCYRDLPSGFRGPWGKFVSIKCLRQWPLADCKTVYPGSIPGVASAFKIKQHDEFRTIGDVQWRRGENHRTVTPAG
jgi:hypothetical protein